jgi:hypothetical protein
MLAARRQDSAIMTFHRDADKGADRRDAANDRLAWR